MIIGDSSKVWIVTINSFDYDIIAVVKIELGRVRLLAQFVLLEFSVSEDYQNPCMGWCCSDPFPRGPIVLCVFIVMG